MWLVFILIMLGIFITGLALMYFGNKVLIAIQKDNDKYKKSLIAKGERKNE